MRQLLGKKKTDKLRAETGLDIHHVMVRGNTGHRKDLWLNGGTIMYLWPDGTMEEGRIRWAQREDCDE